MLPALAWRSLLCSGAHDAEGIGDDELPPELVPDSAGDTFSTAGAHRDQNMVCLEFKLVPTPLLRTYAQCHAILRLELTISRLRMAAYIPPVPLLDRNRRFKTSFMRPAAADSWDGNSSFGGNSDRGSDGIGGSVMGTSRRGMFAVLRIEDLGVIGEKGTKVSTISGRR